MKPTMKKPLFWIEVTFINSEYQSRVVSSVGVHVVGRGATIALAVADLDILTSSLQIFEV